MRTVLLFALIGALTHVSLLRSLELDGFIMEFLFSLASALVSLLCGYQLTQYSLLDALRKVTMISMGFGGGLGLSIAAYRVLFHRLRGIPGPFPARITKFYAAYLSSKNVKYHEELAGLHTKYGDFVRTGPREILVVRSSAVQLVHGHDSPCRKTTWYSQVDIDPRKCSVHTTRDHELHRRRRRAWERGLAIKVLSTYEPQIRLLVDLFVEKISHGTPVDATEWSMFLAFDIMGKIGFGKDFGCLAEGRQHPAIRGIHESMETISTIGQVPWLLYILSRIPGVTAAYSSFFKLCADEVENKLRCWQPDQAPDDIMSWLLKSFIEKDASAPPSKEALHEDSRVMIVGGSGTTATTLTTTLYYLITHPKVHDQLRSQVDAAMPTSKDWTYEKAKSITYIDDVINESLRLKPPVLVGGPRVTPPTGIHIDEQFIPGGVNLIVPIQLLHTDSRHWKQADEFIPQRFGEKRDEFGTSNAPFFPFQLGAYSCPGKNLTYMSLRISLSRIIQQLDFKFAPGEDGTRFDIGWKETFGATPPPLKIEFISRNRH